MLKQQTLNLLNSYDLNFKNIFSICIGKTFLHQKRFINYLGKYNRWDTDVREGILKLDYKSFDVEYIGTTSKSDNFWYSSELENVIPNKYKNLMITIQKNMKSLNLIDLAEKKIELNNEINGYNLSMIYIAFAPENVAYFCGSGDVSLYMFVKKLPESIFKQMSSVELPTTIMEIISTFNINHKLMIKALLSENNIEYYDTQNSIIATFNENSILNIEFDNDLFKKISGNLSL